MIEHLSMNDRVLAQSILKFRKSLQSQILELPFTENKKDLPNEAGIYFLVDTVNMTIEYIGQSTNIRKRWMVRRDFPVDQFNRVYYMTTRAYKSTDMMESLLISIFAPRYNRAIRNPVNMFAWMEFEND
jgi:excinuclease UvrABC nuclease subunit